MRIFGFGPEREKALKFPEFRDQIRLATRRAMPGVQFEHREFGFVLLREGKPPAACNLRPLYTEYCKSPGSRERIMERWLKSLNTEIPEHSWAEAQVTLRPVVKNAGYLENARTLMRKSSPHDVLPYAPFAGDLSVIIMRELPGTMVAVTRAALESWNVSFAQAMHRALNNLNMRSFPAISSALLAAAPGAKNPVREEIGLIFEGDHLTASWLVVPRFRDYLTQRLQGDFVIHVPTRSRLTAIRADEPHTIAKVEASNRQAAGYTVWLTAQGFHVDGATTGGVVTVYTPVADTRHVARGPFGGSDGWEVPPLRPASARRDSPVGMNAFGGLAEPTESTQARPREEQPAR